MRIHRVQIQNFRCLDAVDLTFDDVTTIIGPNGAGKSTILRALDWFFHGGDAKGGLEADDVFSGAEQDPAVSVQVTFNQLTESDRVVLGKYAPSTVDEVTLTRTWHEGRDKMTGKATAFPPFERVREAGTKTDKKNAYQEMVAEHVGLEFPKWTSEERSLIAMDEWERAHPALCEAADTSATHFFGFAGQGLLADLFYFQLVPADLRASEETQDNKGSIIGRILEKTVNRASADDALAKLSEELQAKHAAITKEHFGKQLGELSTLLTTEVASFAQGRSMRVGTIEAEFRPQATRFRVDVDDHGTPTRIDRQGHGFQRSMLVAALKMLAQSRHDRAGQGVIFLAIEEPELFQHPAQAKAFASVLRELALNQDAGIQVGYATHSPYFVDPTYFDQIRRVTRSPLGASPQVKVGHASVDSVVAAVETFTPEASVRSRLNMICLNDLRDALFADVVLLVEGSSDRGLYEGIANRSLPFAMSGIEVASARSKSDLFLPHAILALLGIAVHTVFENDRDIRARMIANPKKPKEAADVERDAKQQENANAADNRKLMRYFGEIENDWPAGQLTKHLTVIDDTIESTIEARWPGFGVEWQRLINTGLVANAKDKDAAMYRLVAEGAADPPLDFTCVVDAVQGLAPS